MNRYTGNGDRGTTELANAKNISKSDDRIQVIGAIEELLSHIGLVAAMIKDEEIIRFLEKIQFVLNRIIDGITDSYKREYKLNDDKIEILEEEIARMEGLFSCPKDEKTFSKCHLSAEIDITRAVARRAERALAVVSVKFGADNGAKKYMNRLGDYLYILARYTEEKTSEKASSRVESGNEMKESDNVNEAVICEVIKQLGVMGKFSLESAKRLIDIVEEEAKRSGKKVAIAVCGPDGNPIAVHNMDGAFLVSFNVAMKKAYTAAAVQMSTMEFGKLAQPGGTFYGVEAIEGGNMVIFGGGVPIKLGGTLVGALGVSGGTGEEDHALAEGALAKWQSNL